MSDTNEKTGFFGKLRQGLNKTGNSITSGLGTAFLGKKEINPEFFEDIETQLLIADVGVEATQKIIDDLTQKTRRNELNDVDAVSDALAQSMIEILSPVSVNLDTTSSRPFVILIVGINGAGKTTTIGKLASLYQHQGKKVMLAAGDTFRAAAVEQLQEWGRRNEVPVISQGTGADSASVIFDAIQSAQARGIDVLIADTAGRLHTQDNLMDELHKIKRVMAKLDESAPHETLLVVDGGTGQNALKQVQAFHKSIDLTGLAITKLDGTAKGGVLFAIAEQCKLPVRYVGVGEGINDLQPFDATTFVKALLQKG